MVLENHQTREKEAYPNIQTTLRNNSGIVLSQLIENLKVLGLNLGKSMISYWDELQKMFIYSGNDPISEDKMIPITVLEPNNTVMKILFVVIILVENQIQNNNTRLFRQPN